MTPDRAHALYRFYDPQGVLLYIGVTLDPGARWKKHRDGKPWWTDVAQITVETHPDRQTVLEAERAAILAEKPRHNIVRNRSTTTGQPVSTPQLDRLAPIQPGDWIALGLADGRCPVGEVVAVDDIWVSVRLKNFWDGCLTNNIVAERWADVRRVELAYPEDARRADPDSDDLNIRMAGFLSDGCGRVMDDEHLGEFQTAWEHAHLGVDENGMTRKGPVEQARADYRAEKARWARR